MTTASLSTPLLWFKALIAGVQTTHLSIQPLQLCAVKIVLDSQQKNVAMSQQDCTDILPYQSSRLVLKVHLAAVAA